MQQSEFLNFLSPSLQQLISIDIFAKQVQKNKDISFVIADQAKQEIKLKPELKNALEKVKRYFLY